MLNRPIVGACVRLLCVLVLAGWVQMAHGTVHAAQPAAMTWTSEEARRLDASLLYPWSWFTDVYNCTEPTNWYPSENAVTTWCDCGGEPDWCGEVAGEFCGNAEGFCDDYCDWSWGYGGGTVTQCEPELVGFVECSCGAIVN